MNLVEELRDDFLMCNICFEEYKEPKQLPCLHTFCRQCLSKYVVGKVAETGAEWFPCPFCRKAIHPTQGGEVRSWADSFPTSFLLSQLSCKLKEKTEFFSEDATDVTFDRKLESRPKCSDHPQFPLVGYCMRQRRAVCEECCVHKHSDCIRNHMRERDSRLMAEDRRSECQETLGALQIKLEGIKDRLAIRETDLTSRKEQLSMQTEAAFNDMRSKLDLFFSEQKRELTSTLDSFVGKETNRLMTAKHKEAELTKSTRLLFEKLASLEDGALSVKDLVVLDKVQDDLRKQEQAVEKLRKDCAPMDIQFYASNNMDKVLRGFTIGTLTMETKSQASGGARPRVQRYISDPSSSVSTFLDHVSLPAQRTSPDVFENAPPPRSSSKKTRALSPPGAGASSLSSSPSTAEGPASSEWDAHREHRRRSEGTASLSATRKTPTGPDFGSVLIEESRRSRSAPRRPRLLSEGSSLVAPRRQRSIPMETAIDGSSENGRNGERNARTAERAPPSLSTRAGGENQAGGNSARPERTNPSVTDPQQIPSEDDLSSLDSSITFVDSAVEGATNAPLPERDQASPNSESLAQSGHKIVCVRHFLANHGSDVKNQPGLVGISPICKDRVAISDRWNKVVKLVDICGRVMDVMAVPGDAEPWDLALRRPGALAVTYPKEQKIRMVDIVDGGSRMYYRSHFMTREGYASLATFDPTTLVASVCPPFGSPKVHIIDYMGAVLRSLDCSTIAYPRCVDMCGAEEVCVSDWTHHNVKVFARDGSIKHSYAGVPGVGDAQLKAPMGVAGNGRGHVFIVDGKGSRLHAVCTSTGTCSAIFSLPQAAGSDLKLLTFVDASPELCRSERALVVTTTSGSVQVYDLCSSF